MTDTTTSHLSESVSESLLDSEDTIQISIVDGDQVVYENEVPVSLVDPFAFDPSHFMPNRQPLTLDGFFEVAAELIQDAQNREGVAERYQVKLTEEYPPEPFDRFGEEVIVYRVLRRQPARMNAAGTARPQRSLMFHHEARDPRIPNKVAVVESVPLDHRIEFSCFAKSNKLANRRVQWLERLFRSHGYVFRVKGAERFHFEDRGPDTYMMSGGQRLFYRPLNFFLRFREFEVKLHPAIRQIDVEAGLD